jgi:Do/DeqQ family serine protease
MRPPMRLMRIVIPAIALLTACSGPASNSLAEGPPLPQPAQVVPSSASAMHMSFAPVVRKVAPAVVNVYSARVVRQQVDPFLSFFYGEVPRERVEESLGSGVIVRGDGVIVTNNHVVAGGQQFMVVLSDRREFPAKVLLSDAHADLAVLKIDAGGERLPALAIADTSGLQVGDLVLAIGDPFGVGQTVTNGIISALNRTTEEGGSYIQTDAPINRGNSGGALVDMNGDLIGINSFILSPSGASSGIGFAIPGAMVRRVVETALGGGHAVVEPWLGAKLEGVTADIARSLGLPRPQGALITNLWPNGSAQRAGLQNGEVILSVAGAEIDDAASVTYQVSTHRPGEVVPFVVVRGGRRETVNIRLEAPPATPPADERLISGRNPLGGATVVNLNPATAQNLGVDPFSHGVMVAKVSSSGYAAQIGVEAGDFVRKINGRDVSSTENLQALLNSAGGAWDIVIQRGNQLITVQYSA